MNTSECVDLGQMTRKEYQADVLDIRQVFFLYCLPVLTGIIGNTLLLVMVACNNQIKSKPILFLISIAAADLILSVVFGIYQINRYYRFIRINAKVGHFLCHLTSYAELTVQMVVVFSLLAVSLERFIVICFPLRARHIWTKSKCRVIIACVWVCAMIVATMEPLTKKADCIRSTITDEGNMEEIEVFCSYSGPGVREIITWTRLCILFAIPFAVMSALYGAVIYHLWRSTSAKLNHAKSPTRVARHISEVLLTSQCNVSTLTKKEMNEKGRMSGETKWRQFSTDGISVISGSSILTLASSLLSKITSHTGSVSSSQHEAVSSSPIINTPASEYVARRQMTGEVVQMRKRVMKMLLLIVALFVICWGPKLILDVAMARVATSLEFDPIHNFSTPNYDNGQFSSLSNDTEFDSFGNNEFKLEYARTYAIFLMLFHSTLNPLVYMTFSNQFRTAFCARRKKGIGRM